MIGSIIVLIGGVGIMGVVLLDLYAHIRKRIYERRIAREYDLRAKQSHE